MSESGRGMLVAGVTCGRALPEEGGCSGIAQTGNESFQFRLKPEGFVSSLAMDGRAAEREKRVRLACVGCMEIREEIEGRIASKTGGGRNGFLRGK